jgi:hypothetical protein
MKRILKEERPAKTEDRRHFNSRSKAKLMQEMKALIKLNNRKEERKQHKLLLRSKNKLKEFNDADDARERLKEDAAAQAQEDADGEDDEEEAIESESESLT